MSTVWKMIQEEKKKIAKHMPKKHKHILVPSQRYHDSRHLLQNPTVPNFVTGFSNRAQRFTGSNYLDVDSPLPYYADFKCCQIWNVIIKCNAVYFLLTCFSSYN